MAQVFTLDDEFALASCSSGIRKRDMNYGNEAFFSTETHSSVALLVVGTLATWFVLVFFLGARGNFVRAPGAWPLPILLGVTAPLLIFLAAFWTLGTFRNFVSTVDLRLVSGIQAWRFTGLGFLALYTYGVLPGRFAWPAGLGDMAIGLTAPWIVFALIRMPGFAASR